MRKRIAPLNLVRLEDRATPAIFTVTTVLDNGNDAAPTPGSLREAILKANAAPGADTIQFAIPGGGVQTIAPPIVLPAITETVVIDGTTQSGFAGTPVIRIDGTTTKGSGTVNVITGLNLSNHTGSSIKSLTIGGFSFAGVRITGGGSHVIIGSLLGTTHNGTAAHANGLGVLIDGASTGNRIGGNGTNERNIISGNNGPGIRIDNAFTNLVAGNFIGTDSAGVSAVPNQGGGIQIANGATGNTIGGVSSGLGNVISGNALAGVNIMDALTAANIVVGNRIGLNFAGFPLANTGPGVKASNAAGSNPAGGAKAGSENIIRSNTIAKNSGAGIAVLDTSRQVRIEGNSIRENGGLGIQIDATANAGLQPPLISSVKAATGGQTVFGSFTGQANTKYQVAIFTSAAADPSGFGEGQTLAGSTVVTTDAAGGAAFEFLIPTGTTGAFITATVTADALGDTSAFSNAFARPDTVLTAGTYAVGGGAGGPATVVLTDSIGTTIRTQTFFDESFHGGVRVATGDLTGDGIPDLAIATGVGIKAEVRVINGATQQQLFAINPFGEFTRGVFVALGDVNNDGFADLVITPDEGGGPRVRVFNGKTFQQIADFFGIDDVNFRGGARAAVGDLNNDRFGDIAVSAGFGGGPRIAVFNGALLGPNGGPKFFGDFFAFEPVLRNGAFVALADVTGDGFAELIVAAGPGGAPRVRILNGQVLLTSQGQTLAAIADFFAGSTTNRAGVRIMARDLDNDSAAELITAQADGSRITVFRGVDLREGNVSNSKGFDLLPSRNGGMFVG